MVKKHVENKKEALSPQMQQFIGEVNSACSPFLTEEARDEHIEKAIKLVYKSPELTLPDAIEFMDNLHKEMDKADPSYEIVGKIGERLKAEHEYWKNEMERVR